MDVVGLGIVITGAASGLGAATTRHLASKGARLTLLDVNEKALGEIARETSSHSLLCDVSDEASVQAAITDAAKTLGEVRALINVAGIGTHPRLLQRDGTLHTAEDFERLIKVNLTGTFHCCRFAAKHMSELAPLANGESGVIVNTGSIAAYESPVGGIAYAASKAGVIGMTVPMARELGEYGIRVMTIAPGPFETPMFIGFKPEQKRRFAANMAFPKQPAKPFWYARMVEHILENEFLNAEVIRIDGGTRLPLRY